MSKVRSLPAHLYRRSPYRLRVAAASAHGARLRARRYGRDTDRLVAEALDRDHWDRDQWDSWQQARLERILAVAAEHVPAYADLARNGRSPALDEFPLLTKDRLRAYPRSFVRSDAPSRLVTEHTSGTSGTPLELQISRPDYRLWYALAEARWRRWYGVDRHARWAILGAQQVVAPDATDPPYWVWNAALNQLYLSGHHVSERSAADYVRALDRYGITYLLGYPSSMHALALACRNQGLEPRSLRVAIANAEPVHEHQRAVISEVFGCPVRETYGMAEYVAAASECDHGTLHLWPDAGVVEVVSHDGADHVPLGTSGRMVCTGLVNSTMPLVRYVVGDVGALSGDDCPCGRTLPVLSHLEGRCDDLIRTPDGRLTGRFGAVFEAMPISAGQIVQESRDDLRVLVVSDGSFSPRDATVIANRVAERVGKMTVRVEVVDQIPVGPNGKLKTVVNRLDPEAPV